MEKIVKRLRTTLYMAILIAVVICALYETEILLEGGLCGDPNVEFISVTMLELLTIAIIPLSLRLLRFGEIRRHIRIGRELEFGRVAMIRMLMLVVPMLLNVLCYYLFIKVAFFYLAIMLVISMVFIYPTKARCEAEYMDIIDDAKLQ